MVEVTFLHTKEDTVKWMLEVTNGVGADAVFAGVGKGTYVSFHGVILWMVY